MPSATFSLAGPVLAVEADDEALLAAVRASIGPLEIGEPTAPAVRWIVRRGVPPEAPNDLPLQYEGPMPFSGLPVRYRGAAGRTVLAASGVLSLDFELAERSGEMVVAPGVDGLPLYEALTLALAAAMTMTGQTVLHAAALGVPGGDGAIMIFAPSGTGKTTTSIALAHRGFALLTDDESIVRPSGEGWAVWGKPRPLKVHRRTADLMPWLYPYLTRAWDENGEQGLRAEAVPEIAHMPAGHVLPVRALVWLRERVAGATCFEPADKVEMLLALAGDNLRHGRTGTPPEQLAAFSVISDMVRRLPTFALHVGGDLPSTPDLVLAGLHPPETAAA